MPNPVEPATTASLVETTPPAPQAAQTGEVPPVTPTPVANEPEAPSAPKLAEADKPVTPAPVTEPEAPSPPKPAEADSTSQATQTAEINTPQSTQTAQAEPLSPSVPLPVRKPDPAVNTKTAKAATKQDTPAAPAEVQETVATESKLRWTPMALAPADKDTVGKPKLAPKRAESAGGYNAKIWSALARHKPKTGKSGSAVVTFAVGPSGGLRSARISGSSGDSQLDQMALQTVRNAAPFPPPPNLASASYTIRIYFR